MKTFQVTDCLGNTHYVRADGWDGGDEKFVFKANAAKINPDSNMQSDIVVAVFMNPTMILWEAPTVPVNPNL